MKRGGVGGAKTQKSGFQFEESTAQDLIVNFLERGFEVKAEHKKKSDGPLHGVSLTNLDGKSIEIYYQDGIYRLLFEPHGVKWSDHFSSRLKPDTAVYSPDTKVLTIIEKKQQETTGSVAEKLQTCDYKMQYYQKLSNPLGIKVELIWLLGSYFESNKQNLRSVFEYMNSKGSRYFFKYIPINELNI